VSFIEKMLANIEKEHQLWDAWPTAGNHNQTRYEKDAELHSQAIWHVHYYPTYAIVDRKGIVRIIGLQPPHVEEVVKKLLDEPAPKS
jgi:hypothetical protein